VSPAASGGGGNEDRGLLLPSNNYANVELSSFAGEKLSPHSALLFLVRPVTTATATPTTISQTTAATADSGSTGGDTKGGGVTGGVLLPQFVGSDIHFSGGVEVRPGSWTFETTTTTTTTSTATASSGGETATTLLCRLEFVLDVFRDVPAEADAHVWLHLPTGDTWRSIDGRLSEEPLPAPRLSGSAFEQGSGSVLRVEDTGATPSVDGTDVWRIGVAFGAGGGKVTVEWEWQKAESKGRAICPCGMRL
jgi:hypothetical protein